MHQHRRVLSANGLELLLLLPAAVGAAGLPLLELSPAVDPNISRSLPVLLVLPLALPLLDLLLLAPLLPSLLLHLCLHLSPPPLLVLDEHELGLVRPEALELVGARLGAVGRPLLLAHEQGAGVGDGLVKLLPMLLVQELGLGLLETVKGIGC